MNNKKRCTLLVGRNSRLMVWDDISLQDAKESAIDYYNMVDVQILKETKNKIEFTALSGVERMKHKYKIVTN